MDNWLIFQYQLVEEGRDGGGYPSLSVDSGGKRVIPVMPVP